MRKRKSIFSISISIGVLLILVSLGILFINDFRYNIHANEIITYTGTVYDSHTETRISMDRHHGTEYDKTVFINLNSGYPISVHQITNSDSHIYKKGEKVTVYEWNGDYAFSERDLFLTYYPTYVFSVIFTAGFMMISIPVYLFFHKIFHGDN